MSINVKSNPTQMNEKMSSEVSTETNSEMKKRRQIRLQQVRQQSKDIAQTIRNKVKKEQDKQISQASIDNISKLKRWQNRKLVQLQRQYQAGLNEIGLGHVQAANEEKLEDKAVMDQEKQRQDAKDRGLQAAQKLQVDKNELNMRKALPAQNKKFAREGEKTRALMSKIKTMETRKSIDNVDKNIASNIETSIEFPDSAKLNEPIDETSGSVTESYSVKDSIIINSSIKSPRKQTSTNISPDDLATKTLPQTLKSSVQDVLSTQLREAKNLDSIPTEECVRQFFLDTRISDRIKSRLLPFSGSDKISCGSSYASDYVPNKLVCCPCPDRHIENIATLDIDKNGHIGDNVNSKSTISKSISDKTTTKSIRSQPKSMTQNTKQKDKNITNTLTQLDQDKIAIETAKSIEIPLKPPVILISSNETLTHLHSSEPQPTNISKVQYYNHKNRYTTEYLTANTNIQKIADENVVQLSDPDNILKDSELMRRRDREAQQRGQKAWEKERVHKEYNDLIQKLPVLQKQERIACICKDKPTFHMKKERLQEVECKRQNVMENAYENLFTNVVTLSPKLKVTPDQNNMPFVTIHNPNTAALRPKDEIKIKDPQIGLDENQSNLLQILLQNLQQQKEMLDQLSSLTSEQNLKRIVDVGKKSSTNSIKKLDCVSVKPLILQNISTQTSPAQTIRTNTKVASSPKRPYNSISNSIDESTSPKKAKKIRNKATTEANAKIARGSRKNKLVKKDIVSPLSDNTDSSIPVKISKLNHAKHKCGCKPTQIGCDQLCEIRICIQDNEKPEIRICSPKKTSGANVPSKPILKAPSYTEPTSKTASKTSTVDYKRSKTTHKSTPKRVAVNNKPTTWSEHFTQNSSSTSTSYYSPPAIQQTNSIKTNSTKSKSAAESITVTTKQIDTRLMTYISKLLDLSKAQIDELNVSSVSEITTPGSSVIECPTNRPMKQLMNVMKLFKLSPMDIATNLNYSKNSSHVVTINSTTSTTDTPEDLESGKNVKNRVHYTETSVSSKASCHSSKSTTESGGFVTKYAEMVNICHQRISDLTTEIEKIRKEKQQILDSHSESDKEDSTVYRKLPADLCQNSYKNISPNSLEEQEQLNEKLLQIQTPGEIGIVAASVNYEYFCQGEDDVDKDIMDRYVKLKTDVNKLIVNIPDAFEAYSQILKDSQNICSTEYETPKQLKNHVIEDTDNIQINEEKISQDGDFCVDNPDENILDLVSNMKSKVDKLTVSVPEPQANNDMDCEIDSETRQDVFFVPLLDDIPRLPKLGFSLISDTQSTNSGKRPPPSKGLLAARKFKGDIIAAPHELSTIAEADSLISAKVNFKPTPVASINEDSNGMDKHVCCSPSICEEFCSSFSSSGESLPDLLAELIGKVNVTDDFKGDITKRSDTDTSTEKSDLETIENMLRCIGMDWAISTLRKTRETLCQNSSSSSSTDLNKCQNDDVLCVSRVECSNVTDANSTRSSCFSIGKDIDVSQISGCSHKSIDKCNRTSTPVQTTKKSKIKAKTFSGTSHKRSDPKNTDDQYLTVPDVSLKSHNRTE